jgi:7,8-dihydropterin-6-yl-methyl-4-(beta-D-ribofuranosyl)aminobenzene 5'-phosphate synthase
VEVAPGIILTGQVKRHQPDEAGDHTFYEQSPGGRFHKDHLFDDLALVIRLEEGLLVLLGCAHSGLINTLRHVLEITGETKIYALMGGTHLKEASPEQVEETLDQLADFGLQKIGVSHCTGFAASAALARRYGSRFFLNNAGTVTKMGCRTLKASYQPGGL